MTVNHGVVGSSPTWGAIKCGPLEKWFNSHAFHACIHGFESRTGHQAIPLKRTLLNTKSSFLFIEMENPFVKVEFDGYML
jgi:hypothetical protein